MELLAQVDGEVDLVVLHAPGQRRALPPGLRPVDRVLGRVALLRVRGVAEVADLALDEQVVDADVGRVGVDVGVLVHGAHQLAVQLGALRVLAAGGRGRDAPVLGQVEVGRREDLGVDLGHRGQGQQHGDDDGGGQDGASARAATSAFPAAHVSSESRTLTAWT